MSRLAHDTAFAIASALTEKMSYKLVDAERQGFHRMVYETCKSALERHEKQREAERLRGEKGRSGEPASINGFAESKTTSVPKA